MPPLEIDATGIHYTPLNQLIRKAVSNGEEEIIVRNVMGQRFIGDGLVGKTKITLEGVPGGDLGMFMKGPTIIVHGNADHAPGNTMDDGLIVVHGSSGDATSHSMRGGRVYIRDDIGYRGGIHMKQYMDKRPILIIGGTARAFLGEYMAGGLIIMLRLREERSKPFAEMGIASGIHGGEIFIRGDVADYSLGIGSAAQTATPDEITSIQSYITDFCSHFKDNPEEILQSAFTRIAPVSARPFANKYTWE
jgi:glutamate synthase domain-containing protein 3